MSKFISINSDGVIWVESDKGDIFGICSTTEIIDCDGIPMQQDTLTELENNGFELNQDWENETTYIDFVYENGETARIVFNNNAVEVLAL